MNALVFYTSSRSCSSVQVEYEYEYEVHLNKQENKNHALEPSQVIKGLQ